MARLKTEITAADHVQGEANAPLLLVEYGDYECPPCGMAYSVVKEVQEELGSSLGFVFRHFPLSEHPHAIRAALAAEAAARQGKFWDMHDILFENQHALEPQDIMEYAEELRLRIVKFESDIEDEKLLTKINSDLNSGIKSGVSGTPCFYINSEKYDGPYKANDLIKTLKGFLDKEISPSM